MNPAPNKPTAATIWNRSFICVIAANLLLCVGHFSVNTLVATYATFLGAAPVTMGLLTGMFFGIALAIRPISGPMITKIDNRMLLIGVFALGGIVNIGYALFHSIPFFVAFRFLNGIQYSFVGSLIMTLAADSLPPEKLASGLGIYGVGGAVGTAFAPAIADRVFMLGEGFGGQDMGFTFVFLFAAAALSLAVIPSVIMRPVRKTREEIAGTGAWYKNIITVYAFPTTLVMFFVVIGSSIINSYVFNFGKEQNIGNISLFYTFMACTLIISRPLSGWLSDRFGVAKIIIPGLVIFAASFVIVGTSKTLAQAVVGAIVAALGVGSSQPAIQAMNMQTVTPLKRSVASNTIYVGMDLGLFVGPLLGSVVYEHSSFAFMFQMTAVPVLAALVCFIIILPVYNRRRRELESCG
ncbi:MAG: MFS transporter [Clostridiales bacterium]|jgi:MFS family permease|nr:MFS transporter [Clostridiales bacterium]